jgi:hypothetical protein
MSEQTKSILMNREVIAIDQDPDAKPVKKISRHGTKGDSRLCLEGKELLSSNA